MISPLVISKFESRGRQKERDKIIEILKAFDPLTTKTPAWESGDIADIAIAIKDKIIHLIEKRNKK